MGSAERRAIGGGVAMSAPSMPPVTSGRIPAMAGGGWELRLPSALRLRGIAGDVQTHEVAALGAAGVEAEFFLRLLRDFPGRDPRAHTHAQGTAFLGQLEAWCYRLIAAGAALEVATQGYLAALDGASPSARAASVAGSDADVWWPPLPPLVLGGEPLELRLRRCGYAYRHVVAVRLASTIETLAEHLAQLLQALLTLPPAGVLPAATLYAGLSELTATLQGYLIPHQLVGRDVRTPGLLLAIARLRQLDTNEPATLASDIVWARAQYAMARAAVIQARSLPRAARGVARPAPLPPGVLREWQATIAALEALDSARAGAGRRG